jgi:hypothetical protein
MPCNLPLILPGDFLSACIRQVSNRVTNVLIDFPLTVLTLRGFYPLCFSGLMGNQQLTYKIL